MSRESGATTLHGLLGAADGACCKGPTNGVGAARHTGDACIEGGRSAGAGEVLGTSGDFDAERCRASAVPSPPRAPSKSGPGPSMPDIFATNANATPAATGIPIFLAASLSLIPAKPSPS